MNKENGENTSLIRELLFTPRGWFTLAALLSAGAGLVLYGLGMIDIPGRMTNAEASLRVLQVSDSLKSRKIDWLVCTKEPRIEPDRLALLGVECWKLPAATLTQPVDAP